MQEKIKNLIENEYHDCIKFHSNPSAAFTHAYDIFMFGLTELLSNDEIDEIVKWWDDGMLPKFLKLFT